MNPSFLEPQDLDPQDDEDHRPWFGEDEWTIPEENEDD